MNSWLVWLYDWACGKAEDHGGECFMMEGGKERESGGERERERKNEWEVMDTTICFQWPQTVCYNLKGPSPPNCTTVWGPGI